MIFHDFGPCRAPKMKPSIRRILIVDFCLKPPARIKIPPFQTTYKHQNHSNTTVKFSKISPTDIYVTKKQLDVCKKSPPPYGAKNLWRRLFAHV